MMHADLLDLRDRAAQALAEAWSLRRRSTNATGETLHRVLDQMHDQAALWFSLIDTLGLWLATRAPFDGAAGDALERFNAAYPEIARTPNDARPVLYPGDGSLWTRDGGYIANSPGRPAVRIEADEDAPARLSDVLGGLAA